MSLRAAKGFQGQRSKVRGHSHDQTEYSAARSFTNNKRCKSKRKR